MNLVWLEDFLAIAQTGNFSRAAQDRHSSQPAFSRRIRMLEEWVGVELLDRSSHPVKLTDAGSWFCGVAQEILARVARTPGEARRVAEASAATLRIACTHALSLTFLPRWLRGLESNVTLGPVQLMSDVLQRCEALMQESRVQFVLSHAHPQAMGLLDADVYRSAEIGQDLLLPVSQPDRSGKPRHRLAARKGLPVPVLHYTQESGLGRIIRAVLGHRLELFPVEAVFTAHLASVLRTMALDGRGLAWLPETLVEDDLNQGRLVPAAGADWNVPVQIRLYRERDLVGNAAHVFWNRASA